MKQIDRTQVVNYFDYGSNMNPERMRERGIVFYSRQRLVLPGYSLRFNKIVYTPDAGAANIVPDEQGIVEGVLYKITLRGIMNLDKFEHYPTQYDRVILGAPHQGSELIEIHTYIAHPEKTREGLKPARDYLDHVLEAEDILSENYFRQLLMVETLD